MVNCEHLDEFDLVSTIAIERKPAEESVSRNVSKKPRRSFIGIQTRRGFCPTLAKGVVQQYLRGQSETSNLAPERLLRICALILPQT